MRLGFPSFSWQLHGVQSDVRIVLESIANELRLRIPIQPIYQENTQPPLGNSHISAHLVIRLEHLVRQWIDAKRHFHFARPRGERCN